MYEVKNSALGHICHGGGAEINDSPITITVNLSVNIVDPDKIEPDDRDSKILDLLLRLVQPPKSDNTPPDDTRTLEGRIEKWGYLENESPKRLAEG